MKSQRHFVVTHSHRHGVTPGLIIAQKGGEKPSPAEAIKLLRMDVEPGREEFVEVIEVSPVFLSKSRSNREVTGGQRARLIAKWATRFYDITESWNRPIGMQLAYLFAAIARGSHVALKAKFRTGAVVAPSSRARERSHLEIHPDGGVSAPRVL